MNPEAQNEMDLPSKPGADDYEAILDSLSAGICRLDAKGRVLYVNEPALRMLGQGQPEVVGRSFPHVFFGHGVTKDDSRCAPFQFTLDENEVSHVNTEKLVRPDGSEFLAELMIVPVRTDGTANGAVVSFVDVTDRRDVELAISNAREEALAAARSKAEFLANMSHEIRTPLTGIVGTVDLLSRSGLDEDQRESLKMLRTSTEFLHSIVNNILDFSKIEAGKFSPRLEDFSLPELAAGCMDSFQTVAARKGIELTSEIDETVAHTLRGDVQSIRQVLNNLLSNALKFTDKGSVALSIARSEKTDHVHFAVKDTGIGIAKSNINQLFAPFTQAESSSNRRYDGTGLGLSISKRLIEIMDGKVGLRSIEGRGTEIWFEIPLKPAETIKNPDVSPDEVLDSVDIRVLVVEDNPINMRVITKMLGGLGISADTAQDGREAVAACRSKLYDIVFMDCQMPGMDGFEAAEEIKSRSTEWPSIIAFTASTGADQGGMPLPKGMDGILRKPFTEKDLINVLNSNSGQRKSNKNLDLGSDIREHSVSQFVDAETVERLSNIDTGDARGFLIEILEIYVDHTSKGLIDLAESVAFMEREKIRRIAHNLKGSSANLGINRLSVYFEELENISQIGKREDLTNILHDIKDEFGALDTAIKRLKNEETPNES